MAHKLEVAFVQSQGKVSKLISKVSKMISHDNYSGNFVPSHVLLILDNKIIFESSTYKRADTEEKIYEKGTRIALLDEIDGRAKQNLVLRCTISKHCDPYLALKYVAKASNYHYSYKSIFKFISSGHLRKDTGKVKEEYICSGLVLDALREPVFDNDTLLRTITSKFTNIDSNSVTPLDLYLAFTDAGYNFRESRGF